MRIIAENVDGCMYLDLIISDIETTDIKKGAIFEATTMVEGKRIYVGLRLGDQWRYQNREIAWLDNEGE